jgi:hypothetical protein
MACVLVVIRGVLSELRGLLLGLVASVWRMRRLLVGTVMLVVAGLVAASCVRGCAMVIVAMSRFGCAGLFGDCCASS